MTRTLASLTIGAAGGTGPSPSFSASSGTPISGRSAPAVSFDDGDAKAIAARAVLEKASHHPGSLVWIVNPWSPTDTGYWDDALPRSARPEYVPGVVTIRDGPTVTVETLWEPVQTLTGKASGFLDMNHDEAQDMITLEYLHEQGVLHNLQQRFIKHKSYTLAGDLLIFVNPYTYSDNFASREHDAQAMSRYKGVSESTPDQVRPFPIIIPARDPAPRP